MNTSKHLAVFLPSLHGGGAERVLVNLCNGFVERGVAVDLVLARATGPYLELVSPRVSIVDLNSSVRRSLPGLVRYLSRARPRVLLSAMRYTNLVALGASRLVQVPRKVISIRASSPSEYVRPSRWEALAAPVISSVYRSADAVIAVSRGVAEDASRRYHLDRARVSVIYNPVDADKLRALASMPARHAWLAEHIPIVLAVGRLADQKDFPTLIDAFALVRRQVEARLMILGEGERRADLQAHFARLGLVECAALPGFVDNPYPYIGRANVLAMSSRFEGLPNVLLEALALGTPIVSTDCESGPREILEDGRWGSLVPVGDVHGLAEALLRELSHPTQPEHLKRRAADFDRDQITEQYLGVLFP